MNEQDLKSKLSDLDKSISSLKLKMKNIKSCYTRVENVLVAQKEQALHLEEQLRKIEARKPSKI